MFEFSGKGIYGAFAIGKAVIFKKDEASVEKKTGCAVEKELERLQKAKAKVLQELDRLYEKALSQIGKESADIFEIHKMLLDDEDFSQTIEDQIKEEQVNAEYAALCAGDRLAQAFSEMQDSYMRERASDIKDVCTRLINALLSKQVKITPELTGAIICAQELTPGETAMLEKDKTLAFLTEKGGYNSHTAILARSMGIPAVTGLPSAFFELVKEGDLLCVDGYSGSVILLPDDHALAFFKEREQVDKAEKAVLGELHGKENITKSGKKIQIFANIGSDGEVTAALQNDAGGIGLLRSEFSYLEKNAFPSEEELFLSYKSVLSQMQGKKVIIRTLDIGADKQAPYFSLPHEENPALGMRGVRICLSRPKLFKTQLRAIFRASVYGTLGVMFPMITSEAEVKEALAMCEAVKEELRKEGVAFDENIELGIMIETPAAAVISDRLARLVDFFSIGTNDLTQYTLACDRQNTEVERFADPYHEAVFRLIAFCAESIHATGGWIGICGELAADTSVTDRFLDMNIDELSVSPSHILKLRKTVLELP